MPARRTGSIELLKSYGDKLKWVSRPDRGAFNAINDGWKMSKGEIFAWVNSDDMWDAGAAEYAATYFQDHPDIDVLYGTCGAINATGILIDEYPPRPLGPASRHRELRPHYQPDGVVHAAGNHREGRLSYLSWCHDHDLWLRIAAEGGTFGTTPQRLARPVYGATTWVIIIASSFRARWASQSASLPCPTCRSASASLSAVRSATLICAACSTSARCNRGTGFPEPN